MAIPSQLIYQGQNKEFQFRDMFVMPLLIRLGFGVVVNYHGQREFGRDVIFGDVSEGAGHGRWAGWCSAEKGCILAWRQSLPASANGT